MAIKFLNSVNADSGVLYVDAINNRVGIGTTSPGSGLDVRTISKFWHGSTTNYTTFAHGNEINTFNSSGGDAVMYLQYRSGLLNVGAGTLIVQSGNNNVGIGTTSPSYKLDVAGNASVYDSFVIRQTSNAASVADLYADFTKLLITAGGSTGADHYLALQTQDNYTKYERMRITSIGNVGIGTSSPSTKLQTVVDFSVSTTDYANGTAGSRILIKPFSSTGDTYSLIQAQDVGGISNNALVLQPYGDNVGIGTTNPSYKLDVAGDARIDNYLRFSSTGTYVRNSASGALVLAANSGYVVTGWGARLQVPDGSGTVAVNLSGVVDSYINGVNLGIGTTSPSYKLDVAGLIDSDGYVNNNVTFKKSFKLDNITAGTYKTLGELTFLTTFTHHFRVTVSSYAGFRVFDFVGYQSSLAKTISGHNAQPNRYSFADVIVEKVTTNGNVTGVKIAVKNSGTSSDYVFTATVECFSQFSDWTDLAESTTITESTVNLHTRQDVGGEVMYIDQYNQKVGIGTNTPSEKLHVLGSGKFEVTGTSYGNQALNLYNPDGSTTQVGGVSFRLQSGDFYSQFEAYHKSTGAGQGVAQFGTYDTNSRIVLYSGNSNQQLENSFYKLVVNSNTAAYVTSTGNVGIGTTNPSYKLQVEGGIKVGSDAGTNLDFDNAGIIVRGSASGNNSYIVLEQQGIANWRVLNRATSGNFEIASGSSSGQERLAITTSGNVGIGTTTPNRALSVHSPDNTRIEIKDTTENIISHWGVNSGAMFITTETNHPINLYTNSTKRLTIDSSALTLTTTATNQSIVYWGTNTAYGIRGGGNYGYMGYNTGGYHKFMYAGTELMRINPSGNVGIGTTTPGASLHVASTTSDYVAKFSHSTATGYAPGSILLEAGQSDSRGQGLFHYNTVADESWFTGVPYAVTSKKWIVANKPDTTFNPDVAQLSYALMTIDSNTGNVGIGTTSPLYKLDVRGTSITDAVNANIGYNITRVAPPVTSGVTYSLLPGTDLPVGTLYYSITYYNAVGETSRSLVTVITTAGNQQVQLENLPISPDSSVIGRKIYRSKLTDGSSYGALVATISDNTTTSYLDTLPESDPVFSGHIFSRTIWSKANTSSNFISVDNTRSMVVDTYLTTFGFNSGASITRGGNNTFIGSNSGQNVTYGSGNTLIGQNSGILLTTGNQNIFIGDSPGSTVTTGSYNIALGPQTLKLNGGGEHNIAMGYYTGQSLSSGNRNILLGSYIANGTAVSFSDSVIIGVNASYTTGVNGQVNINNLIFGNKNTQVVGIGTTAPTQRLHVEGGNISVIDGGYYLYNHSTALSASSTSLLEINKGGFGRVGIYAGGSELLSVTNAGSVGVGTTTPVTNYKLHVIGSSRTALLDNSGLVSIVKITNSGTGNGAYNGLDFVANNTNSSNINSYGMPLTIATSNTNGTAATERMRITGDGNVGIGTTLPDARLTVTASSGDLATFYTGTTKYLTIKSNGNLSFNTSGNYGLEWGTASLKFNGQTEGVQVIPFSANYVGFTIKARAGQTYDLQQWKGSNGTPLSVVDANGNFGIGNSNPSEKLHVSGNVRIEGDLTVNGSYTQIDTDVNTTEQWNVTNDGTGPAVTINQKGAQDIMDVQDDGTSVFYIEDGGNVGIGVTDPTAKLDIAAGASGAQTLLMVGNNGNGNLKTRHIEGKLHNSTANDILHLNYYADDDVSIVAGGGNVMIGAGTATQKLEVAGNVKANRLLLNTSNTGYTLYSNGESRINDVVFTSGGGSDYVQKSSGTGSFYVRNNLSGYLAYFGSNNTSGQFTNYVRVNGGGNNITIRTNDSDRVYINSAGNVGIGTTSPTSKLDVAGAIQVRYSNDHTTGDISVNKSALDLYNPLEADTDEKGSIITFSDNYQDANGFQKTTRAAIKGGTDQTGNTAAGFLAFYTDSSSANSATERMRIDDTGNVGIGTNNPGNKLHIVTSGESSPVKLYQAQYQQFQFNYTATYQSSLDFGHFGRLMYEGNGGYLILSNRSSQTGSHIRLETSDTERLRITHDGKVGIGTTLPSYGLHVNASAYVNDLAISSAGDLTFVGNALIQTNNNSFILNADVNANGAGFISLRASNVERLKVTTSGAEINGDLTLNGDVVASKGAGIYTFSDTVTASTSEDIFSITNSHGAQAFRVTFVSSTSGYSVAKTYEVVHSYGNDPVFFKVVDTGAYNGHDFDVSFTNLSTNNNAVVCAITNNSASSNADIVTTVFLGGSPTTISVTAL